MSGTTPGMKRKEDITELINAIIEQAMRTRGGFTPEVVNQFYEDGMRSREERQRQQMREATPVRQLGPVVARKREENENRVDLSPEMKRQAVEEAVRCAEMMEIAISGRRSKNQWATS